MKNLKVKDLIQRLQCLDEESGVWFYLGKSYKFMREYAQFIINNECRLNGTEDGISRNLLISGFAIESTPDGEEYAAVTLEPNFVVDGPLQEVEFYKRFQHRRIPDRIGDCSRSEGEVEIDGIKIKTTKEEIVSANILEVEAGTTGYCGGDTGHGGRTYFRISNAASTDMRCRVKSNGEFHCFDGCMDADQIEIMFGGDCEMDTFISALRFAADTLEQQHRRVTFEERKAIATKMQDERMTNEE